MAPDQSSSGGYLRALLFIGLTGLIALWINHHFGYDLVGAGGTSVLVVTVVWAVNLCTNLFGQQSSDSLKQALARAVDRAATIRVLIVLGCLFLGVALLTSSVTIIGDSEDTHWQARLTPVGADRADTTQTKLASASNGLCRFRCWTSPFGRTFRLKVDGYLGESIVVYPIVGTRVQLDRDLRISPSLLVRPPAKAMKFLDRGGYFVLLQADSEDTVAVLRNVRRSYLVGQPQAVPASFRPRWDLELRAQRVDTDSPQLAARTLLEWGNPTVLSPRFELAPMMKLVATLYKPSGKAAAEATFLLSAEPLIDVPMVYLESLTRDPQGGGSP